MHNMARDALHLVDREDPCRSEHPKARGMWGCAHRCRGMDAHGFREHTGVGQEQEVSSESAICPRGLEGD